MNIGRASVCHPRTNSVFFFFFETQQISARTLTGNWSASVTQSRSIYAPYSSSLRLSCGSRNEHWTHVFWCGDQYSHSCWGISFGKRSRSSWRKSSARCGSRQTVRLYSYPGQTKGCVCACAQPAASVGIDAKTVKSSILAFLTLLSLSPVMKTLTASTSSDSIWALSACLFILNALIADYSSPRPEIYSRERCGRCVVPRSRSSSLTVGRPGLHQCFPSMLPSLRRLCSGRGYPTTSRCLPSCCTPSYCLRCSPSYAIDYR